MPFHGHRSRVVLARFSLTKGARSLSARSSKRIPHCVRSLRAFVRSLCLHTLMLVPRNAISNSYNFEGAGCRVDAARSMPPSPSCETTTTRRRRPGDHATTEVQQCLSSPSLRVATQTTTTDSTTIIVLLFIFVTNTNIAKKYQCLIELKSRS